jgi:hypothetical protein
MTVDDLLTHCHALGIQLAVSGARQLTVKSPPGAMTADIRQGIRTHAAALFALLLPAAALVVPTPAQPTNRAGCAVEQTDPELIEERAAIYKYDGQMTRAAAEALAQHGHVVALPACPMCHGMSYQYADGSVRCTTPGCNAQCRSDVIPALEQRVAACRAMAAHMAWREGGNVHAEWPRGHTNG